LKDLDRIKGRGGQMKIHAGSIHTYFSGSPCPGIEMLAKPISAGELVREDLNDMGFMRIFLTPPRLLATLMQTIVYMFAP
jgi:hypothetical protein